VLNFEQLPFAADRKGKTMTTPEDRLTTLEIRNAEQEHLIEELSGQIAQQWTVIDRMQKKLDALAEPVTKPPHW